MGFSLTCCSMPLVNGDTNNDGLIELSELAAHIQTQAPKLTGKSTGRAPANKPSRVASSMR
jgi:hypothetical protein